MIRDNGNDNEWSDMPNIHGILLRCQTEVMININNQAPIWIDKYHGYIR